MIKTLIALGVSKQYAGDVWLFLLLILVSVGIVFIVKKRNLTALALSVFVSYGVTNVSAFSFLKDESTKTAYFFFVVVLSWLILKRLVGLSLNGKTLATTWFKAISFALAIVLSLISIVFSWLPNKILNEFFTPFTKEFFTTDIYVFVWMILPVVFIYFFKRKSLE